MLSHKPCQSIALASALFLILLFAAPLKAAIANCLADDGLDCLLCDVGYLRSIMSPVICVQVQNCLEYEADREGCKVCQPNYMRTFGQPPLCQYISPPPTCVGKSASCYIPHCTTMNVNRQDCDVCDPGYTKTVYSSLSLNSVVQCTTVANCAVYDGQYEMCMACEDGYYYKNGLPPECVVKITNCKRYLDDLNCLECKSGYYVLDKQYPTPDVCVLSEFCKTNSGETCTECLDYFYLDNGTPRTCRLGMVPGCIRYTSQSECDVCDSVNHYEALAAVTPRPNKCNTGWYKLKYDASKGDPTSQVCVRTDNCRKVNQNNWCSQCRDYYALIHNADADPCPPSCFLMTGQPNEITNCVQYHTNTSCRVCAGTYYPLDEDGSAHAKCTRTEHCLEADGSSVCTKCKRGYSLNTLASPRTCVPGAIPNCKQYADNDATVCSLCDDNYQRVAKASVTGASTDICSRTLNCAGANLNAPFNDTNYCQLCSGAYQLFETMPFGPSTVNPRECLDILTGTPIANCLVYRNFGTQNNFAKLRCAECQAAYYVLDNSARNVQDQCTQTDNCRVADGSNVCTGCKDYHYLDTAATPRLCRLKTALDAELIKDCKRYSDADPANVCLECKTGYYTVDVSTSICSQTANCSTAGADQVCTACMTGFCFVTGSSPKECRKKIMNCADPDALCAECTECLPGFYRLINGGGASDQCTRTQNCAAADADNLCTACLPGYVQGSAGGFMTCTAP